MQHAEGNQQLLVRRDGAEAGADGEERERPQEHRLRADAVAKVAGNGDHCGQGQKVAGRHPVDRRAVGVKVGLHLRQCHSHDGTVKHRHEDTQRDDQRRLPLVRQSHRCCSSYA